MLPKRDYIGDVRDLYSKGFLSEAEDLADFALANSMTSSTSDLIALREKINVDRTSAWGRAKRLGGGFAYGDGRTPEELIGAIASDMVLYGDVRDLVKQGYYKASGRETDMMVVALSGIGVCTEFVDAVDWAPAVLKACRKINSLTGRFTAMLISSCKESVKARKLSEDLIVTFREMRGLKDCAGVAQTVSAMKYVNHVDDLKLISKYSKQAPVPTSLMLKSEGLDGLRDLEKISGSSARRLRLSSRAGKRGFEALRNTAKSIQRFERMVKAVPLVGKLLLWTVRNVPLARWVVALLALLIGGRGILLIVGSVRNLREKKECSDGK